MNIDEKLKKLRKITGETQKEVAEKIGITETAYQNYERKEREPKPEILVALADHFNTSTDYILGRTDNPSPPLK